MLPTAGGPGARALVRKRQAWRRGRAYTPARWLGAVVFAAAVVALVVSIVTGSAQAFAHYGVGFVWSTTYSPGTGSFGAGLLIVGTLVTTGVAIVLAAPVGLGAAIALSELVPKKVAAVASTLVELLAAVPSIVIGLWALLVLTPLFRVRVEPFLHSVPLLGLLFGGPDYGPSIILASTVLAVMTLPTLVSLSRTAFRAVPVTDREAALALGATRWQVVRRVVWPAARPGVSAAVTLAIGRALGEAIAVAMVIGNIPQIPRSLAGEGATLGSAIVNQFSEAESSLGTSSVIALGAVLLVLTVAVNAAGQALRRAGKASRASRGPAPAPGLPVANIVSHAEPAPKSGTPALSAVANPRGRWLPANSALHRHLRSGLVASVLCGALLVAAVAPLIALLVYTISRAAPALSFGLLTGPVVPAFVSGGGIGTAIAGSARVVGLGLVMAAPVGLLAAMFLYERSGRLAAALRFSADVLSGVPSILIGIFAYEVIVRPMHHASVLAAGIALAFLMLPIMVRANEEAVRAVAVELQEAGAALGAPRWRVVRSVVLRGCLPGLVAGNLLALARAVGETAPLLFTLASPSLAITLLIFNDGTQPYPSQQQLAWAAALVLLLAVLALSALARATAWSLTRRSK
ncbi:MAG TPA: phosphate ABC transporter permease subunit PstC [Acidimicrobiales bacterium]|nr:phosphate ABC transporter permease subunit PstC [Acidimicrobiales bacterium]